MNLQCLVLSVLRSQTKVTPALLIPNSHRRVTTTHHSALETKEEDIALLTYMTDMHEKLFPGDFTMWTSRRIHFKRYISFADNLS